MPIYYRKENKAFAQELRRNMTKQEKQLWYKFLRGYKPQFRRQKQFGKYIVDFYCSKAKLVIELDGGQHFTDGGENYDKERSAYLENIGLRILRFMNTDVDQRFNAVCETIDENVKNYIEGSAEE